MEKIDGQKLQDKDENKEKKKKSWPKDRKRFRKNTFRLLLAFLLLLPFVLYLLPKMDDDTEGVVAEAETSASTINAANDGVEGQRQAEDMAGKIDFGYKYFGFGDKVFLSKKEIRNADVKSFKAFNGAYSRDRNAVYIYGEKIINADPRTFAVLSVGYAMDKNNVYFFGKVIRHADLATFEVVKQHFDKYTKDKNKNYSYAEI